MKLNRRKLAWVRLILLLLGSGGIWLSGSEDFLPKETASILSRLAFGLLLLGLIFSFVPNVLHMFRSFSGGSDQGSRGRIGTSGALGLILIILGALALWIAVKLDFSSEAAANIWIWSAIVALNVGLLMILARIVMAMVRWPDRHKSSE